MPLTMKTKTAVAADVRRRASAFNLASVFRRVTSVVALALILLTTLSAAADRDVAARPARPVPPWLRASVFYEIYPRAFSASGDFNGITARLDELKNLGVDVLWLMPIHPIGEKLKKGTLGSPYAVKDYYAINPEYGTTNDFRRLVKEAHAHQQRVILDLVANHTAWDNVLIAAHPEFYKQDATGKIIPPVPEWTDVAGLNYANPQLRQYMINMLKYWITEYGVDGYRCDVAHMVPVDFWEQARAELEKAKPDVLMLAEASQPELLVKAFDLDYSWPLHATLNKVLLEGAPATDLRRSWEESRRQFPQGSLHLRISDNHDEARAVARFGIRGALAAQVFMMTLDGVPLFYNGMEVGDATESGDPALFEQMPVFWKPKERPPLRNIYRDLIKLRRNYAPFRSDGVTWLHSSNDADLMTFMRHDNQDEFVVVINFSNRPQVGWVEVMNAREFKPVKIAGVESTGDGFPLFRLNGFEWRIYHRAVQK
jgi:cyclomaltodextrinase